MNTISQIYPDTTINQIVAAVPNTLSVFQRFGLDTCCGGGLSLSTAVERHQLSLETLLAALRAVESKA
jgi:regulator of cell morphogenesis and NO signaling